MYRIIIGKIKKKFKEQEKDIKRLKQKLANAQAREILVISKEIDYSNKFFLLQIQKYISEAMENAKKVQKKKDLRKIDEIKKNLLFYKYGYKR